MEHIMNTITLRGSLLELPQFSHENHGRRFFRFYLEVPRLSGAVDLLPVIAEESLYRTDPLPQSADRRCAPADDLRFRKQRCGG